MKSKSKHKVVEVYWIDSAFNRGWGETQSKVDSMGVATCRTVGYLIGRDKRQIKVALSLADNGESAGDGMSIPAACVTRVKILS